MRPKQLLTVLGRLEIERAYYVCPHCHQGQSPRDRELDVEGTQCSAGVRRMMALAGSEASFDTGREQLELPAVCAPAVPILYIEMDGTGVPVVAAETEGRVGMVEGRPVRDEDSTTYTAAIESAEEFGVRLYTEAWRRGWSRAKKKVVLGDGAVWIWNLADQHFPGAIQIVDLYHARQRDHRPALLPPQRPLRGVLGDAVTRRLMVNNYVAHPPLTSRGTPGPSVCTSPPLPGPAPGLVSACGGSGR